MYYGFEPIEVVRYSTLKHTVCFNVEKVRTNLFTSINFCVHAEYFSS